MTDASVDAMIEGLTEDLRPTGRLMSPGMRALAWLGLVAAVAALLAAFSDLSEIAYRLHYVPDMWLAVMGSVLTTILGAVATFQLSLPDRSPGWALLPLPGLAVWIAASGMGCLRAWVIPDMHAASLRGSQDVFHLHRRPLGAALDRDDPHGPASLPDAAQPGGRDRRDRRGGGGGDIAQLLPPLRCRGDRPRRPRRRDRPRDRGQPGDRRPFAHAKNGIACDV